MSVMESPKKTTRFSPGRGRLEGGVGVPVAGELAVIVSEDRDARGPVLVEAGEAGGGNGGLLGRGAERRQHDGRQ